MLGMLYGPVTPLTMLPISAGASPENAPAPRIIRAWRAVMLPSLSTAVLMVIEHSARVNVERKSISREATPLTGRPVIIAIFRDDVLQKKIEFPAKTASDIGPDDTDFTGG